MKHIIDQGGNFPLNVTKMIREDYKKIYNMDILALTIAGEASQPDRSKFLTYKKIVDFLLHRSGYNGVLGQFHFTEWDFAGTKETRDMRRYLPISPEMKRYLLFLDEHHKDEHQQIAQLLGGMDEQKEIATAEEKQEIQKIKRFFVNIYRRKYPKDDTPSLFIGHRPVAASKLIRIHE